MTGCDFLVIGAGISGASAAFELAAHGRVILLERESQPGFHSTGRSAALYTPNYGNRLVRALDRLSLPFFRDPPPGFAEHPLLRPRGALTIASAERRADIDALLAMGENGEIREITPRQAAEMVPILRPEPIAFAAYEPGVMDMDVHAIHRGFLKGLTARGGTVVRDAAVTAIVRQGSAWQVDAGGRRFCAAAIVNAAGAWAEEIGKLAGLQPIGLTPKRRTVIVLDPPPGYDPGGWPMVDQAGEGCYFKPEAQRLLVSPGDETAVPPGDAQPEELDVALAVDWLERAARIEVRHVVGKWAGLRSFVADEAPVVGPDPVAEGFYWLAGQGGFGIMLAPTLARAVATLVTADRLPADIVAAGIHAAELSPGRLRAG